MLYFIRHGQSQANVDHIFAGSNLPVPLTELGRQQARSAAREILDKNIRIDQVISSPLRRAYDTAAIISGCLGIAPEEILLDARLSEYDVGELAGESTHGITAARLTGAPGAEDPAVFQTRVTEALGAAARLRGNVLIVSHAGVGQIIEVTRKGLDPADFYAIARYSNAQIVGLCDI